MCLETASVNRHQVDKQLRELAVKEALHLWPCSEPWRKVLWVDDL